MFDGKTTGEMYTLTISNNTTVIGCNVHAYGSDVVVKIPEGVTHIAPYALQNCTGIQRVILPNTLKDIGQAAFIGCLDLEAVYIPDTVKTLGVGIFRNCPKLKRVHVPQHIKDKTKIFNRGLPSFLW